MVDREKFVNNLPEWYRMERDTEKTLSRLTDMKAIRFYLEHSDPYIRRLAIIRTGNLKSREAYSVLCEVADDRFEDDDNRIAASYYLNQINDELNLGYFIQPYAPQSDKGDYETSQRICIIDELPNLQFNFSGSLIESQLQLDQALIKSNLEDKDYRLDFSIKDWFAQYFKASLHGLRGVLKRYAAGLGKLALKLPVILFALTKKGVSLMMTKRVKKEKKPKETAAIYYPKKEPEAFKPARIRKPRRPRMYSIPLGLRIKDTFRTFFRILFWPLRVLFHFKYAVLGTLLVMYIGLSFTHPGKAFLFRINPVFYEKNAAFVESMGHIASSALSGTLFVKKTLPLNVNSPEPSETPNQQKEYLVVTATKGLYLRQKPDTSSEKILLMKKDTQVIKQDEKKDAAGIVWYQILLKNGTTGWANSQWLKEE